MIPERLTPKLGLLSEEYVLVQAWKKTASYIRSHNWYADTLELDRAAVNLPDFLQELSRKLSAPQEWNNDPLRIVPAPKSQPWSVDETGVWRPVHGVAGVAKKLRPLAHVTLKDQVAATALMLCLADRVETQQGDPCVAVKTAASRGAVSSYGNRLFCDTVDGKLLHRWGSSKLYRSYFQDYRNFLTRPETASEEYGTDVVIINSDLKQFYDRVTPALLAAKIDKLKKEGDDPDFFEMARKILLWRWDKKDSQEVNDYSHMSGIANFTEVALPQGLVASGFFSNVVLMDFDEAVRAEINSEFIPGATLRDACRYVDDVRLVLTVDRSKKLKDIETDVVGWLQRVLTRHANGLVPSPEKTQAAYFRGGLRPLVRQSRKMERIQHAISGGFDAIGGEEILDAVQGLVRSQQRYSKDRMEEQGWAFAPISDVRDETVARFAAARFRSTFRSLRPLLENARDRAPEGEDGADEEAPAFSALHVPRTRSDLDDEAKAFALGLIENWVEDPSNVRLLRIGLDIWPDADVLRRVLDLLHQYTAKGGGRKAPRRVARYCLAEIFRAGATETGFVEDGERLPDGVDIAQYRAVLLKEAKELASLPLPWYLKQQILLFLAANKPDEAPIALPGRNPETRPYRELIRFLKGEIKGLTDRDYAIFSVLSRRSFLDADQAAKLVKGSVTPNRAQQIALRDPSFGLEVISSDGDLATKISPRLRQDLCIGSSGATDGWTPLSEAVLRNDETLRNELTLLTFVKAILDKWPAAGEMDVITPCDVLLRLDDRGSISEVEIRSSKISSAGSLYKPPAWCSEQDRWRVQLGYLVRFILTSRHDFTRAIRSPHWKEGTYTYRTPESHWYQRIYGLHNGHSAFGADWLPITDWTEQFLYALSSWPGVRTSDFFSWVKLGREATIAEVDKRIQDLQDGRGEMSGVLTLPIVASCPDRRVQSRPLRVCVVQTVTPAPKDIATATDLSLSDPVFRNKHRNHLSAALAAVERMLDLRETHRGRDGRLDLLLLPELAVHPRDIETHLVPFVRTHKTIILTGLTYEELFAGQPLINSALWLIPTWSKARGLEVLRRRQGKQHLAPEEKRMNSPVQKIKGFRPCQWRVGYEWDLTGGNRPLWLTAAICYDATDIRLAADLRRRSDVFAITAMNQDVNTFDQMAMALQYHMYQMVIIANNGHYGGSNAYAPYRKPFIRQVFHIHGQPQASIAFLEIDKIEEFVGRDKHHDVPPAYLSCENDPQKPCNSAPERTWKCPPAGLCSGEVCVHKS